MKIKTCALRTCKQPFTPVKPWQRFHQDQCRTTFHNRIKQMILRKAKR